MAFLVGVGVLQFVYCVLVGNYVSYFFLEFFLVVVVVVVVPFPGSFFDLRSLYATRGATFCALKEAG